MAQSLGKVLIHIVFSTKLRYPYLADKSIRDQMHAYLGGTCKALGCPVLTVGGAADHVHILCLLARTHPIASIVGDLKRASSKWIKTKGKVVANFAWQNGYGVFSVGQSEVERVKAYIAGQEEHHRIKTSKEEYRLFLEEHDIPYDERYVWD